MELLPALHTNASSFLACVQDLECINQLCTLLLVGVQGNHNLCALLSRFLLCSLSIQKHWLLANTSCGCYWQHPAVVALCGLLLRMAACHNCCP